MTAKQSLYLRIPVSAFTAESRALSSAGGCRIRRIGYNEKTLTMSDETHQKSRDVFGRRKRDEAVYEDLFLGICLAAVLLTGCAPEKTGEKAGVDYSLEENWAYCENGEDEREADVFFICPTVFGGTDEEKNMAMDDEETKANFLGATNMEKGIYDGECRFFAPYYRQIGLNVYELPAADREEYLELAYEDVQDAFEYYCEEWNDGRPIVLAGFSQGADMCLRLMKDCFDDEALQDQLVACYAIGWSITEEELEENPHMKAAQGEADTGVIISFNSEAESITDSLMIPSGTKAVSINPLNWKTDGTKADKNQNLGACFTDYDGNIVNEIPELTGAYIDSTRGALKVTDVTPEEYPASLYIFEDGIYHLYDYQFFYRNLQENVKTRVESYMKAAQES